MTKRYSSSILDTILLIILEEYSLSRGIEDDIQELSDYIEFSDVIFHSITIIILNSIRSMYHELDE